MKIRFSTALTIVLLGVLVFNLSGNIVTAQASSLCNAASFIADLNIPDGTYINPGAAFTKTWRLKNTGSCAWSTQYALVFSSGERMGGSSPIYLTRYVSPGQSVDLTVNLTAPVAAGTYRGYWKLQNGSGTPFGIGGAAANAFWVEIRVLGVTQSVTAYDFVANMCSAKWVYNGGPISCPVNNNKLNLGYVIKLDNPNLEDGTFANAPALLTVPQNKYNGVIQGIFPVDGIMQGDHFQAIVSCQYGATNCSVRYQLDYMMGSSMVTLWKFIENYDGLYYLVDIDLSPIARFNNVQLVLSAYANGPASGDLPLWVAPRIVRNVAAPIATLPPTATPLPTATATPITTPGPLSCTDRAQFVTDATIPDGTVFAPNATFNKVWRLKNVGTCTWSPAYDLTPVSGAAMGGVDTSIATTVMPGQTVDLGVNLTAPSTAGSYKGFWELKNAVGSVFGIGTTYSNPFWVAITVSGTAAATSSTPATATPVTATATPVTAAPTATPFASGWFLFQDAKYAFEFQLPPGATVASKTDNSSRILLPFASGTNLVEKYLDVSVIDGATTCQSPYTDAMTTSQTVTINGIQFLQQTGVGNAMSNQYNWRGYSTVKGVSCISLNFTLHSINPGVMPTPPPVYDSAAESAVFSQIMSTYGNQ